MGDQYQKMEETDALTQKEKKIINKYKEKYCDTNQSPIHKSGIFSKAFFMWMSPIFKIASKTVFQQEYHYNLREIDTGRSCYERLKAQWDKAYPVWVQAPGARTTPKNLIKVVFKTYPGMFILYMILSTILSTIEFLNAKIMQMALEDLQGQEAGATFEQKLKGAGKLIFALIFTQVLSTLLRQQNEFIINLLTQRIKHGVNGLIFDKVMMKSIQRDPTFSVGEITNITQVDVERISNMGSMVNRIFIAPIQIIAGTVWLWFLVGNVLFMGLAFLIIMIFVNIEFSKEYKLFRTKFLHIKDKRGKLVTEVFSNIRYIKMSGLENYFLKKIQTIKDKELYWIKRDFNMATGFIILNNATPLIFLCLIFGGYMYFYGIFTVALIFTVMQVYNIFRWNFSSLPFIITWCLDIMVSGKRITFFLLSENIDDSYIQRIGANDKGDNEYAIEISNGNFYWEDMELRQMYKLEKNRIAQTENKYKNKEGDNGEKRRRHEQGMTDEDDRVDELNDERRAIATLRSRISTLRLKNQKSSIKGNPSVLSGATLGLSKGDFGDSDEFDNFSKLTDKFSKYTKEDELDESLITREMPEYKSVYQGINLNLKDINVEIKKGACVAIIGSVGSGKSSLLSCLSGEMYNKIGTRVKLAGSIAYVSQKAWIPSMTVKQSIIFGNEYDEKRYQDCIKYACMTEDLKILAKQDETLLGDKGVNLSGGQKIRLSIARAMYSNDDIYLFDDPISALDIHVGKYVMEEGIINYLKGKTRVVATHAIAYLKFFDYIYIMDEGQIVEQGDYETIIHTDEFAKIRDAANKAEEEEKKKKAEEEERKREEAKKKGLTLETQKSIDSSQRPEFKRQQSEINSATETSMVSYVDDIEDEEQKKMIEDIIQSEDRAKGSMSWSVVTNWLSLMGGFPRVFLILTVMIPWSFTKAGIPWFLQWWATNFADTTLSRAEQIRIFLGLYVSINLMQIICDVIRLLSIFGGNIELSREVNFLMTFRTIHASINKYFDRVPLGRLLNRFMKDVQTVDSELPWSSNYIFFITFSTITTFTVTAASSSVYVFIIIFFYLYISFRVQRYYMNLLRELTRLKSISSTPIIQKFKEGLEGVSTIRFFNKYETLFDQYLSKVDDFQKNSVSYVGASNWFNVRVSILALMVIIPTIWISLFVIDLPVGVFGLMLNFILQMTSNVNSLLSTYSDHENRLVSLERCCYFMNVKPEEGYRGLDILERALRTGKSVKINTEKLSWPTSGDLRIKNLSIRYRKDLPYVIKKLNLDIKSGTKVGIVGRTGAGKTTLISAIYRTFDEYKGKITIDGKEIRDVDLKVLRYTMTIIPQDPYLFEDTLRNNIDPMGQFSDNDIQEILEDVDLWRKFTLQKGLETQIEKGGSNLSQGEKQLVCLSRALLYKNKLVLMDEATANIDIKTEATIQQLIKERFEESTILMIAHRLNTILHCDKVLVLEQGEVLEYDDLNNLKGNEKSHFGRMLMKSDEINESLK